MASLATGGPPRNFFMKYIKFILFFYFVLFIIPNWAVAESKTDSLLGSDSSKNYSNVRVEHVVSAGILTLESGEKIRLIGLDALDAPRRKGNLPTDEHGFPIEEKADPQTPMEEQAYDFVKNLLEGQYVRLEFDAQIKSDDFKTLAYVFLKDGTLVNAEILRQGFANLKLTPLNRKYAPQLREAYQEARREKRGLQSD